LLELAEPAFKLAMRDVEAMQIVLEFVEFRLPRSGVGVELALDSIQLGVERKFGLVARVGQCGLHVRTNTRRGRGPRRIGLCSQTSGFGAGLRRGVARLRQLIGELARAFGGLTARL